MRACHPIVITVVGMRSARPILDRACEAGGLFCKIFAVELEAGVRRVIQFFPSNLCGFRENLTK